MPQLPITAAIPPLPSAGASQASAVSAVAAPGAEGGEGEASPQGLSFSAVFTKQLKGVAPLLEKNEGAGILAVGKDSVEPAVGADAVTLPIDLSVLTASMLVPVTPVSVPAKLVSSTPASSKPLGTELLADSGAEKSLIQLPKGGEAGVAADVAANGKNSPQVASPDQAFADKLAALVETPVRKVGSEAPLVDLSAAANSSTAQVVQRNSESLPALPVSPRVGSVEWSGAVGERVVWMANQSHQVAELHLNPPNLGPLEVRLTISNDQATALFVTQHLAVREAIEMALPRLREMLADNGIMLGNVTVGSESFSQQQTSDQWKGNGSGNGRGVSAEEGVMHPVFVQARSVGLVRNGMVDIFA